MNDAVSPIRGPFTNFTEFMDTLLMEPLRFERLSAIEQRLQQDPSILVELKAEDVLSLLDLMPVYVFEDWNPSDSFIEDFFAGDFTYANDGSMVGGPSDVRFVPEHSGPKSFNDFIEALTLNQIHRRIHDYFRRTLQPKSPGEILLNETKFWPLMTELDHLDLIYGINNPVKETMDFLAMFISPTPTCSKSAREKLKQVLMYVFENSRNDELKEMTSIAKQVVRESTDFSILSVLYSRVTFSGSGEEPMSKDHWLQVIEPILKLDRSMLSLCLATLPIFFKKVEELELSDLAFNDEKLESKTPDEPNPILIEGLIYGVIIKIIPRQIVNMSRASLAISDILIDTVESSPNSESRSIFELAKEAKRSTGELFAHVPTAEIALLADLAKKIEKRRLKQTLAGRPVFLDARGFFASYGEPVAFPKRYKKPKFGVAISKAQVLLRNTNGYHLSDLEFHNVLSIAELLAQVGYGRIGANLIAMLLEGYLSQWMNAVCEDQMPFYIEEIEYTDVVRLFKLHAQISDTDRIALDIAIGRLYQSLADRQKKFFLGHFPRSTFENNKVVSASANLSEEVGVQRWKKLKKDIQEELIVGENSFRQGITKDWKSDETSSRTSVNHWAAAVEGLFYEFWVKSFTALDRTDLNDHVVSKLDAGTASLAEMVNFFLEVPKRLKKSAVNASFVTEFQASEFSLNIASSDDHRRNLKLLGLIRGRAAHFTDETKRASKISPTDVFAFRQCLFSSGLLSALVDSIHN